jgi:biopolymer transport protein ExbD
MRLEEHNTERREIDLIMLIDVVFLLLIFFLVAATTRPFMAQNVKPSETMTLYKGDRVSAPLIIDADARVLAGNELIDEDEVKGLLKAKAQILAGKTLHIVADRKLPAQKLIDILEMAKSVGIHKIRLVTQRRRK